MTIGQNIRNCRKKAGLTQKELGELLSVSASMIGQYENDLRNPKYETLQRIAEVLNVKVQLLDERLSENIDLHLSDFLTSDSPTSFKLKTMINLSIDGEMISVPMEAEIGKLLYYYGELNEHGMIEAIKRVEELTQLSKYRR